jgi:hypothetical protein
MADVAFSTIYDQVIPYLPGAEPSIIDTQIRKAVREWMKRTTMYRETFIVTTVAGVSDYKLVPGSTDRMVSSIMAVYPAGSSLPMDPIQEDRRHLIAAGQPRGWFSPLSDVISFYPQPDAAYDFTVNAVLTLPQNVSVMPEELAGQHAEALAAGVLSLMMDMPGKPWTQSQVARGYGRVYSGAIKTERGKLRDGGQPNHSTLQPRVRFGV